MTHSNTAPAHAPLTGTYKCKMRDGSTDTGDDTGKYGCSYAHPTRICTHLFERVGVMLKVFGCGRLYCMSKILLGVSCLSLKYNQGYVLEEKTE